MSELWCDAELTDGCLYLCCLSCSSITAAATSLFSCIGDSVVTYGLVDTVGNWSVFLSRPLNRKQFVNRITKEKTCNMPLEVGKHRQMICHIPRVHS